MHPMRRLPAKISMLHHEGSAEVRQMFPRSQIVLFRSRRREDDHDLEGEEEEDRVDIAARGADDSDGVHISSVETPRSRHVPFI
jgi:hypothetical protein